MAIELVKITLEPYACKPEVDKYGEEGLRKLWMDILERYAYEEYYDPDLVDEILEKMKNGIPYLP